MFKNFLKVGLTTYVLMFSYGSYAASDSPPKETKIPAESSDSAAIKPTAAQEPSCDILKQHWEERKSFLEFRWNILRGSFDSLLKECQTESYSKKAYRQGYRITNLDTLEIKQWITEELTCDQWQKKIKSIERDFQKDYRASLSRYAINFSNKPYVIIESWREKHCQGELIFDFKPSINSNL